MAAKGSAAKSASGASMSKYDVEVERRLQALEVEAHPKCHHDTEVDVDHHHGEIKALEAKVDNLILKLKNHFGDLD